MSAHAVADQRDERYPSLHRLREAHAELLDREQAAQGQPAFWADVRRFLRLAQATGALLDRRAERRAAQSLLDYWVAGLIETGAAQPATPLAPFDELAAPTLPDEPAPYVGLDAFDEATEDRFFGRGEVIAEMLQRLQQSRMLAVVGSSGSGKSSVIRAGVLARLRHMAAREGVAWQVLPPLMPGSDPLEALVHMIYQATPGRPAAGRVDARARRTIASLAGELRAGRATLAQLIDSLLRRPVVLTVDQFEEIFILCRDEEARAVFVANLLGLIDHPRPPHRLILTMRSDFEARVALLADLKPRFDAARVQVTALSISQLREAIEGPAQRVGLVFEEGIVDDLIAQALGESAALPLLQFTLSRLWELRTRNRVRMETYRALGGMSRALSTSADAWYQQLIPEDQVTARRIFLDLVRPADRVVIATEAIYKGERRTLDRVLSEGLEVTRGRVRVAELYRTGEDPERIKRVLDSMAARRLVRLSPGDTPEDDQIEVAHEALIRNWETLQGWVEQDLERLRRRARLIEAASRWEQSQQSPDLLWRGTQLEEALRTSVRDQAVLAFLRASKAFEEQQRQQQRTAREQLMEARQREAEAKRREAEEREQAAEARASAAETARRRAEDQVHNTRRLRVLSVILALLTVVAVIAMVFAFNAAVRAQHEAVNADVQRATAQAAQANAQTAATAVRQSELTAVADRGAAITAANERATAEANAVVLVTSVSNERATAQIARANAQTAATAVRRSELTAQADRDAAIAAANERGTAQAAAILLVTSVSNERATAQAAQTNVALLNATLQAQNQQQALTILDQNVQAFITKANNVTESNGATSEGVLDLLNQGLEVADRFPQNEAISDGIQAAIQRAEDLRGRVIMSSSVAPSVAGSADASYIAVTDGMFASVWDVRSRTRITQLSGHTAPVQAVAWSHDGAQIATASSDRTVRIWRTSDRGWDSVVIFKEHKRPVLYLAWSRDGARIVSADGAEVIVWDSVSGKELGRSAAEDEQLTQAAWSPDGGNFVTASQDGLRLRNGITGALLTPEPTGTSFISAAWSPDGQRILTVNSSGDIQIWNASGLGLVQNIDHTGFKGTAAMWSPSGDFVAVGGSDNIVRIYATASGNMVNLLRGHHKKVTAVAWSPDGLSLMSASQDRTVRIFYAYPDTVIAYAKQIQRLLGSQ